MHEKTLFIIGIFICLLFAVPMVSAADLNLMDDSIGSDINSQAIAAADANSHNDALMIILVKLPMSIQIMTILMIEMV